jgi:hypothetical protein
MTKRGTPVRQLTVPGYKHLQPAYHVTRNGKLVLVPLDKLSAAEVDAIDAELRRRGAEAQARAEKLRAELRRRQGN